MNLTFSSDDSQLKQVILHYKQFYLSLGIIIICAGLFMWVIIPQVQQYLDQTSQVKDVEQRIAILQKNTGYLATLNEDQQAADLQMTTQALPDDKDYAGILYAVRNSSSKSGVGLGDFTFSIGELSAKNAISKGTPFVAMNLNVLGSPAAIERFLIELSQAFPLSNVTEIHITNNFSIIIVQFYYKPIPQLRVNYSQPISPLTGVNGDLLSTLRKWYAEKIRPDLTAEQASASSASPFGQ